MISVPYLLIVWTMSHGTMQTAYSSKAACENARHTLMLSAVGKDGKPLHDLKAVCITQNDID